MLNQPCFRIPKIRTTSLSQRVSARHKFPKKSEEIHPKNTPAPLREYIAPRHGRNTFFTRL